MAYSPNRIAYYRDRCQPPLTQRTLAQALGKHVNTIVLWEKHGVPSPSELLRLCALFVAQGALRDLNALQQFWATGGREPFAIPPELLQLLDGSVAPSVPGPPPTLLPETGIYAPLPPQSRMPLHRNRLFSGRTDELQQLAAALRPAEALVVLSGMAGLGKTQLAAEFGHRYGANYPGGVFWLSFADPLGLPAEVAACGEPTHLDLHPAFGQLPLEQQVRLVQAAWREATPRLLIFDNCEDEQLLAHWRPTSGGCQVLVTSRRAHWSATLVTQVLPLPPLDRASSVTLLRAYTANLPVAQHDHADPATQATFAAIAEELGDLPLALHLAGSYLAQHYGQVQPQQYLHDLRASLHHTHDPFTHASFQANERSPTHHEQLITRSLHLSYRQLRPHLTLDRLALDLLARAACFAPGEPIPRDLLVASLPDSVAPAEANEFVSAALDRLLGDLGLLSWRDGANLSSHRLVTRFVQAQAHDPAAQLAVEQVLLAETERLNGLRLPTPMRALQRHLRVVGAVAAQRADLLAAELLAAMGWQATLLNEFAEAEICLQQAYQIRLTQCGADHPTTAMSLNLLGLLAQFQSQFLAARDYFAQALQIWQQVYGWEHLDTATAANNLGYLLFQLGEREAARHYLHRALLARRRISGLRDEGTARTVNNLGYVLLHSGQIHAARRYLKLALAIREQVLPEPNPATAQTLNNLGEVLYRQGDYAAALVAHQRALQLRHAIFGPDHFHAAESMRNLALVLAAQGQTEAARHYLEQALAICEQTLGEVHIETAWKLDSLGSLLIEQGEPNQARPYLRRALAVYTQLLEPAHPTVQRMRIYLAASVQKGVPE